MTVVMPLYNKAATIERALRSVINQAFGAWVLIVVDDGSTDGSAALVETIPDQRVRLVRQANAGEGAARNAGVRLATTSLVAFLDADDEWRPDFLGSTVAFMQSAGGVSAVFTNLVDDRDRPWLPPSVAGSGGQGIPDYLAFWSANKGKGATSSSIVVRVEALREVGGFPEGAPVGADTDTWARLGWTGRLGYLPQISAVYHTEAAGSVLKADPAKLVKAPVTIATYQRWLQEGRIPPALQASARDYAKLERLRYADRLLRAQDRRAAFRELAAVGKFPRGSSGFALRVCARACLPLSWWRFAARLAGLPAVRARGDLKARAW